jgi:hypothetical protein
MRVLTIKLPNGSGLWNQIGVFRLGNRSLSVTLDITSYLPT